MSYRDREDDWYDLGLSPERYSCSECDEKDEAINDAAKGLARVLRQLYTPGEEFDPDRFESGIHELCHILQMNIPKENLKITSKEKIV